MNCYCFILALVLLISCILCWNYYNDGGQPMRSSRKVMALILAISFLAGFIIVVNIAFGKEWGDALLEIFNNLSCTFLGVVIAFFVKRNAFRPENFD